MNDFDSIKDVLDKSSMYTGLTRGTSMWPLIHQQQDNIIVIKNKDRLKKYDVPVYVTKSGKYIMHRIVSVKKDHYVIIGDNRMTKEYVTDDMICGVLVGFYKNGEKYIDCQKSKAYKLYSRLWVFIYPIRPLIMFVHKGISFINRHILKRGDTPEK